MKWRINPRLLQHSLFQWLSFQYSFSSFSNTMSSWFQYEALKFVSFPTQVLCKASKIIPVMLMGKLVSKKSYPYYEYVVAVLLSAGVSLFLLAADPTGKRTSAATTFSGAIMLLGYMAFDSFTSNWQSELFMTYKMSTLQMMFGANLFSCLFTVCSMIEGGNFFTAVEFMMSHATFCGHAIVLSLTSATGQLFIFYTIQSFGPVVFTIIMTVRMMLSIMLSCLIYSHPLSVQAMIGVIIVFVALFLRVYARYRSKAWTTKGWTILSFHFVLSKIIYLRAYVWFELNQYYCCFQIKCKGLIILYTLLYQLQDL